MRHKPLDRILAKSLRMLYYRTGGRCVNSFSRFNRSTNPASEQDGAARIPILLQRL